MTEKKKMLKKKFSQSLKCILTDVEILQAGENMANAERELNEHENELTSIKAQFKGKIETSMANLKRFANLVRDKFEYRSTECESVFDYTVGRVVTTRLDTGLQIEDRPMTEDELQMEMDV